MTSRITLDLTQHAATEGDKAAYLLSLDGKEAGAKWIPKSLCTRLADGKFLIEAWKARQCGFLIPQGVGQGRLEL
jgi:hypothetical protein